MTTNDDYILINYKKLAERLAEEQFHREYDTRYRIHEIYEQVDDSNNRYMKPEFQSIFYSIQEEWEEVLMNFDVINLNNL